MRQVSRPVRRGLRLASASSPAACHGGPDTAEPAVRYRVVRRVRYRTRRSVDREHGGRNGSAREKEPRQSTGVQQLTRRPLRGRQHHRRREGEAAARLPGCGPTAGGPRMGGEPGRAHGCQRGLQGRPRWHSEADLPTPGQSAWLRVRGDGESPCQGEAASGRCTDRGHQERHAQGGHGPRCTARDTPSCPRASRG